MTSKRYPNDLPIYLHIHFNLNQGHLKKKYLSNHHQNNDVPAVTTKLDGVVLQRTHVMKERVTVMVLVMVVYMMVMMVVRGILLVEATTVRSLATIIMKRMIAVNNLRQLNLMAN